MAIGDKPNQNLFGTNYNAEEEERKKAELAAQGAMMGANIPASAFGQAPAVAPFSMEAAGQVNPMMQPQNLESFAQPQVTFRDYDVPEPPRASALSVFTPGGEVKPNVDVNAITPSPEMTSTSAVNTALNQEVPVGSPENNDPSFMSRLGSFLNPSGSISGSAGLPPIFTPPSAGATQAQEGTDITPVTLESLGLESAGQKALKESLGQPPSNIDPFTGKTIEKPTPFDSGVSSSNGMTMNQKAIMDALGDQNQGMDMNQQAIANAQSQEAGQGQVPTAPTNGLTTVGGASLSEFLSGQAMPEQGFTQEESPLGGRGVTLTQDQMNQLSAERESRIGADQAISDRDRRAARGDGISMADQVDMAKANARGATPREVARGNQVANALGVDLKTGQPLQATGGLTESELQRRREFAYKQEQDILAGEIKAKETEGERSVNRAKAVGSLQALKADLDLIKETGEEVKTLTLKPRTEGLLAKALATVSPTSTAAQLERASGVLTGDAFIKGMQVIKAFGGGLGSVTEVEGLKVERAQGAIFENGMGDEERRQAVKDYIQVRENAYNRIREAFVKEYGETDAQTYLGTQNTNATAGKAIPNDRNVSVEVSPELEQYFN
jgi:hypothetical protein